MTTWGWEVGTFQNFGRDSLCATIAILGVDVEVPCDRTRLSAGVPTIVVSVDRRPFFSYAGDGSSLNRPFEETVIYEGHNHGFRFQKAKRPFRDPLLFDRLVEQGFNPYLGVRCLFYKKGDKPLLITVLEAPLDGVLKNMAEVLSHMG